jgi:signal peptidase II
LSDAARRRRRWSLFAGLAAGVLIADQLTKEWIRANVPPGQPPVEVIGEYVRLIHTRNTGGIFGLFGESALVLAMASTVVIALIVVYQARDGARGPWLLAVALGLLLGGALGNFIDRLRFEHVTDFVDVGIGTLRWYTFNVADAAISIAIVLFLGVAVLGDRLPERLR